MKFGVHIFDSELKPHAIIVNRKEVKPERRLKADKKKLPRLITRLLNAGYSIHPFLNDLKAE
ncbi:MAG: hypothetical protein DRJ60_05405 [Thermoprotei archaeon]|nr:MAG: hypothetical protein DRJ60_05405 [Thermoprotei archaeon]